MNVSNKYKNETKSIYDSKLNNKVKSTNDGTTKFDEMFNMLSQDKLTQDKELQNDDIKSSHQKNIYEGNKTENGTNIIQPGEDMDKDAFLRILAAQLSNQDPTQPQDGTEYVSQFAQFASMEQMTNLNTTMSGYASQSLMGKGVVLNAYDSNGQAIMGIVRTVAQSGSRVVLGVEYVNEKGEAMIGEFENSAIASVLDVPDNRLDYLNNNMAMLVGSSMINKEIDYIIETEETTKPDEETVEGEEETKPQYETKTGTVQSVVIEDFTIKLKVKVEGMEDIQTITLDKVVKVNGEKFENKF